MRQFIFILIVVGVLACGKNLISKENGNDLIITVEELNRNLSAYSKALTEDGVWVTWNAMKQTGFPKYSIYGGYDDRFNPSFIARMTHKTANNSLKVIGKLLPMSNKGSYGYDGREYDEINVEVLIHKNHIWTEKEDGRFLIRSGSGGICRIKINGQFWIPGALDEENNKCSVAYNGTIERSTAFETLRRACDNNDSNDESIN